MISDRTAKLMALMPKPLLGGAARYIINRYLNKYANITVVNPEKLDGIKGPAIFISKHLSNSDGLVINKVLNRKDVWFVAGIKLSKNHLTSLGLEVVNFIAINPNSADRSAVSKVVSLLKSGQSICMFPEGTRSRQGSLIKAKRGILLIAKLSGCPIIPLGLEGTEKLLPINDDDMGKESFQNADVRVTVGDSFYLPSKDEGEDRRLYEQRMLNFVMGKIAGLLSPKYRGIYSGE
jgi:1-acyl-sn-glycerol-3-phosphate acyltransferase